jgi:hypothetical protein
MYNDEDLFIAAVQKAIPIFVVVIAASGGACFTIFAPPETLDHASAVQYSTLGVLGTLGLAALVWKLLKFPPTWRLSNFGRNLVIFLLCLCWVFGAVSGFIIFYVIPRQAV